MVGDKGLQCTSELRALAASLATGVAVREVALATLLHTGVIIATFCCDAPRVAARSPMHGAPWPATAVKADRYATK